LAVVSVVEIVGADNQADTAHIADNIAEFVQAYKLAVVFAVEIVEADNQADTAHIADNIAELVQLYNLSVQVADIAHKDMAHFAVHPFS